MWIYVGPIHFFIACIVTIQAGVVNLLQRGAFCSHFCYIIWLHKKSPIIVQERNYILLHPDIVREAHSYPSPLLFALVCLSSILVQERKYPFPGTPEMSDKLRYEWWLYLHPLHTSFAFLHTLFSLLSCRSREKTIHTPLYTLSGNSRNEWQIEIWVANRFKILCAYYIWSLSWTIYYYHIMQNNPVGETNNSSSSIALDDPSSILMKRLCIFARTIIPTSFLILLSYNAHLDLSNMMTREKRILIWLLINYLIKLTN